jgi:FAD/FMN-containing dehydrogenase
MTGLVHGGVPLPGEVVLSLERLNRIEEVDPVSGTATVQAGVATPVFARTAVSFLAGRVYTITARGDATIATTGTAVNRAFLDNSVNR